LRGCLDKLGDDHILVKAGLEVAVIKQAKEYADKAVAQVNTRSAAVLRLAFQKHLRNGFNTCASFRCAFGWSRRLCLVVLPFTSCVA